MAGNTGGPWGGGGNKGSGGGDDDRGNGGRRPGDDRPNIPEIDDLVNKGREQLRVLMGGGGQRGTSGGGGGGGAPQLNRGTIGLGVLVLLALWVFSSLYSVRPEERSVELFLGEFYEVGQPGLNFAPWPIVTYEKVQVTQEQRIDIGTSTSGGDAGLMLTGDENIVDIDFQVVWNISDPAQFKFTLADPPATIRAVSEAAMREIVAQSDLTPILNTNRNAIAEELERQVQRTLDEYQSGVNVVRVNFNQAVAPNVQVDVTDAAGDELRKSPFEAFEDVQSAAQESSRLQNLADAYANRVVAEARGEAAAILEQAEAYRAEVVNNAIGEASRFAAVLEQYELAPEVTRKRIYLETMETVLGRVDVILLDENGNGSGQGVVPYLPLNEIRRQGASN